jgi:hypothetical protein
MVARPVSPGQFLFDLVPSVEPKCHYRHANLWTSQCARPSSHSSPTTHGISPKGGMEVTVCLSRKAGSFYKLNCSADVAWDVWKFILIHNGGLAGIVVFVVWTARWLVRRIRRRRVGGDATQKKQQ